MSLMVRTYGTKTDEANTQHHTLCDTNEIYYSTFFSSHKGIFIAHDIRDACALSGYLNRHTGYLRTNNCSYKT